MRGHARVPSSRPYGDIACTMRLPAPMTSRMPAMTCLLALMNGRHRCAVTLMPYQIPIGSAHARRSGVPMTFNWRLRNVLTCRWCLLSTFARDVAMPAACSESSATCARDSAIASKEACPNRTAGQRDAAGVGL